MRSAARPWKGAGVRVLREGRCELPAQAESGFQAGLLDSTTSHCKEKGATLNTVRHKGTSPGHPGWGQNGVPLS